MGAPATFVHDLGEHPLIDAGTVIALTASAFEACRRAGRPPTVLDDHTEQPDLCLMPEAYQRWQLDWLRRLDAACQLNGVARSCAQLIIPAIDSLVVTARMLAGAVDALTPESITYVGKVGPVEATGYHNGHLQFWPRLGDVPLAARLLGPIATARSLPLARCRVDDTPRALASPEPLMVRMRRRLSRSLGPYRLAYKGGVARRTQPPTTLMLWYANYGAKTFAADEHRAGRSIASITRGGDSFRIIDPALPPRRRLGRRIDLTVQPITALPTEAGAFLEEIDAWAGVPGAGAILEGRLAVFLRGICPTVALAARRTLRELPPFHIARLAAANPSSIEEFACLIAARSAGIPRVLVQHGDHLLSYGSWLITQTGDFDEFAASDPTMEHELGTAAARLGVAAPRVTYYAPRVTMLRKARSRARQRAPRSPGPVGYVPGFLFGDSRYVGGCNFDSAWYHRWHLRILDLMQSRSDCRFIWKGLPSSDQSPDPIPGLIAERADSNVSYESRPFIDVVAGMDRIVTDYPSTALYESVYLGKPVLALIFPRFCVLRPPAAAQFAQVLRSCDTEEEALAHISEFLDADPAAWTLPERSLR